MDTIHIIQDICIEAKFLGNKFKENLYKTLSEKLLNFCDEELGYITHLEEKSIKIKGNSVSQTGAVFVKVECVVKRLLPKLGKKYSSKVCMVLEQGVMVSVNDIMKIFIPTKNLSDYKLKDKDGEFYFKKSGGKYIKNKGSLMVKIDTMRYEKRRFNCIGSLA